MKKKFRFHFRINLKNKHILVLMTLLCISMIIATFASKISVDPLREVAGTVIVPFEKSINGIGKWLTGIHKNFQEKEALVEENQQLQEKIDTLTTENNNLIQSQSELAELREMYDLDQEYAQYPKVMAKIISKDAGNWYNSFVIDKGTNDGIAVDMNVISGKGLVGIVTEAGPTWATVRSIIDDSSNVSGQTVSTSDTCIVEGDLELINSGKLRFTQLYDENNEITAGERIVTSNISDKYVKGLLIGYVSEIEQDSNNLTKTGTIVTPVDFRHLDKVFVITQLKEGQTEEGGENAE